MKNLKTTRLPGIRFATRTFRCSVTGLLLLLVLQCGCAAAQEEGPEKGVTFYTTYGFPIEGGWKIPLKIWVYEEPGFARRLAAKAALAEMQARATLADLSIEQEKHYVYRTHDFIADSESNEKVEFQFDNDAERTIFRLQDSNGKTGTDRNGLIEGEIILSTAMAQALLDAQDSNNGWLSFSATSENHGGVGRVRLIPSHGVSIISDVDDTIKVTDIPAGEKAVLNNTFFREYRATPCMADMYSNMDVSTAFHYVSGGPWQLYRPLSEFLFSRGAGFPEGSFHMKDVRTNPFESESYRDIWGLIATGSQEVTVEQKVRQISALLHQFPQRKFILIGDSGEMDPEIFSIIREDFSAQLAEIRIRDVVNAAQNSPERLASMTIIRPRANSAGKCELLQSPTGP